MGAGALGNLLDLQKSKEFNHFLPSLAGNPARQISFSPVFSFYGSISDLKGGEMTVTLQPAIFLGWNPATTGQQPGPATTRRSTERAVYNSDTELLKIRPNPRFKEVASSVWGKWTAPKALCEVSQASLPSSSSTQLLESLDQRAALFYPHGIVA